MKTHHTAGARRERQKPLESLAGRILSGCRNSAQLSLGICEYMAHRGWKSELNQGLDTTWECIFRWDAYNTHYGAADSLPKAIAKAYISWLAS